MDTIDLAYAKEHLEELIARATRGEDVRISDAKGAAVRLLPAGAPQAVGRSRVVFGQWKHLGEIPEERILAPLGEDELAWLSGERSAAD
jgi:antitoxin (DNA-binding transcriptional repressor) of toxin-antitoxin stability system